MKPSNRLFVGLSATLGLLLSVAGCTGTVGGGTSTGTGNPTGSGVAGNTGSTAGNSGSAGNNTSGSAGNPGTAGSVVTTGTAGTSGMYVPLPCTPGIPTTTQLRRMQNWQYDNVMRDLLGVTTVTVGASSGLPSTQLYADFDGPMVPDAWRIYNDVGSAIAKAVMANATMKAKFIACDPATSGCLMTTIQNFGKKAFRRPLTTAEVTRFMNLGTGTPTGTPAEVAEATLYAFLVSPSFLTLPELDTTTMSGSSYQLNSYEVASRLSFMLWGSIPDDALMTEADNSRLTTAAQILTQANRMIAVRDKTTPLVTLFHRNWVQMNNNGQHWWNSDHDMTKFPIWNTTTSKTSLGTEMDNFFAEITFTNGQYKDLFLSPVGFINKDNAGIYGMSSTATALTKVNLDPVQRPGFMTRAGFLASYSHFDMTAPILRGAFITIYMIGVNPGAPDPSFTMLKAPAGTYPTVRDMTDALVNQSATCMGCHTAVVNPPGYVMENYDAVGAWQTTDKLGNGAINPVATVNFGDGNVKQISNAQQLMTEIAGIQKGRDMYSQSWVSFAYARQPNPQDQCVANDISTKLGSGGPILNVLADLTQADSFRLRNRAP
jgi:Protein of unknown function (DUF1592)/Protein of unknown function (DUF1588)/Protein of unknown function (DUF1595)